MPTDSTGNTTINWDEIEKIVGKDASEITAEEYYALSVAYLNLDAEDLTRFLSLFIDKTKDVDTPLYTELFGRQQDSATKTTRNGMSIMIS